MINVRLPEGSDWTRNARLAGAREVAERELGSSGRVLIRASGTEPVLRALATTGQPLVVVTGSGEVRGLVTAERLNAVAGAVLGRR